MRVWDTLLEVWDTLVMYDWLRCLGRFASRPVAVGGAPEARSEHVQGAPRRRRRGA